MKQANPVEHLLSTLLEGSPGERPSDRGLSRGVGETSGEDGDQARSITEKDDLRHTGRADTGCSKETPPGLRVW